MSLGAGGSSAIAYQADNDRALSMFATALKVASRRSTTVAQLLECANRALAVGETQLDSVRLDGLQATDDDVEVTEHSIRIQVVGRAEELFVVVAEILRFVMFVRQC